MSPKPVTVLKEGDVAEVTIDRREKRNALNLETVKALHRAFEDLAGDETVRAVVLAGAGERAFVAGADIAELERRGALESLAGINARLFTRIEEHPVPVVAAVRGWALGGGMELAMACDLRIAGKSARFGQPELRLGILPAAGGMHRLPALAGMGVAKDLILTGRILSAEEALCFGIVSRVVEDDEVLNEARGAAREIAGMAPLASRLAKRVLNALWRVRPDQAFALESAAQAVLFESEEKRRRMRAFLERKQKEKERGGKEGGSA